MIHQPVFIEHMEATDLTLGRGAPRELLTAFSDTVSGLVF